MTTIPKWDDNGRKLSYDERLELEIAHPRSGLERIARPTPTGECGYCHRNDPGAHRAWCPRRVALDHLAVTTAVESED